MLYCSGLTDYLPIDKKYSAEFVRKTNVTMGIDRCTGSAEARDGCLLTLTHPRPVCIVAV